VERHKAQISFLSRAQRLRVRQRAWAAISSVRRQQPGRRTGGRPGPCCEKIVATVNRVSIGKWTPAHARLACRWSEHDDLLVDGRRPVESTVDQQHFGNRAVLAGTAPNARHETRGSIWPSSQRSWDGGTPPGTAHFSRACHQFPGSLCTPSPATFWCDQKRPRRWASLLLATCFQRNGDVV
jgi:hypothetical protein